MEVRENMVTLPTSSVMYTVVELAPLTKDICRSYCPLLKTATRSSFFLKRIRGKMLKHFPRSLFSFICNCRAYFGFVSELVRTEFDMQYFFRFKIFLRGNA